MRNIAGRALLGFLMGIYVTGVWAAASAYEVMAEGDNATLVLHLKAPPDYKIRQTDKGRVLNFQHPLDLPDMSPAAKRLQRWLQSLWAGYDALLVKPQPGVQVRIERAGNDLMIHLEAGGEPPGTPKSRYPLERVEALLLLKSGKVLEARQRFADLVARHPGKVQPLLDLAGAEERLGRWRQALDAYEHALKIAPDSLEVAKARSRLRRVYGSRVKGGASYLSVGNDETRRMGRLEGRYLAGNGMVLALEYELRDAKVDVPIHRVDGRLSRFKGQRYSLALHLEQSLGRGEQRVSLFAGDKTVGLGWRYRLPGDDNQTEISLEWRKPWYESSEALAGYGARDRIALHHDRRLNKKVSLSAGASYNRYGLEDLSDAARSVRLQGGVRYYWSVEKPEISFGYNLDWEDMQDQAVRVDGAGQRFFPLPLEDREQHTIDAVWRNALNEHLVLGAQVGFEYDRRRDAQAPFGRLQLDYDPSEDFTATLNLETGLSSYRGGDDSFYRIGGDLTWRF